MKTADELAQKLMELADAKRAQGSEGYTPWVVIMESLAELGYIDAELRLKASRGDVDPIPYHEIHAKTWNYD